MPKTLRFSWDNLSVNSHDFEHLISLWKFKNTDLFLEQMVKIYNKLAKSATMLIFNIRQLDQYLSHTRST